MRLAYADPPYLGCCGLYDHYHPDGNCWDDIGTHRTLVRRLRREYDGWVVHLSAPSLPDISQLAPEDARFMSWVKPFAAFKANVSVAYAWEPVIVKAARKPEVTGRMVMRDWIAEPITLKRGLTGAKPERVCMWAFEMMGAVPGDELHDLFPGSGAVTRVVGEVERTVRLHGEHGMTSRDVTPIPKETRPWRCRKDDASCTRGKPCASCRGARNRRKGKRAQGESRRALEATFGAQAKWAGKLANEETWDHVPVRSEGKAGKSTGANAVGRHYLAAEAQSEAARPVGDARPFVATFSPDGMGDALFVIRRSKFAAVLEAYVEAWANQ